MVKNIVKKHITIYTPYISIIYFKNLNNKLYNYTNNYVKIKIKLLKALIFYNQQIDDFNKRLVKIEYPPIKTAIVQVKEIFLNKHSFFKIHNIVINYYVFYKPHKMNIIIYYIKYCFNFLEKSFYLIPYVFLHIILYNIYIITPTIIKNINLYLNIFFKNFIQYMISANILYWQVLYIQIYLYLYIIPTTYYFCFKKIISIYMYILKKIPVYWYTYSYFYPFIKYNYMISIYRSQKFFSAHTFTPYNPITPYINICSYIIYNCIYFIIQFIIYMSKSFFLKKKTPITISIKYKYLKKFFFILNQIINQQLYIYLKKQLIVNIWFFCIYDFFTNMIFFFNFLKKFDKLYTVQKLYIYLHIELINFFKINDKIDFLLNFYFLVYNKIQITIQKYIIKKLLLKYTMYYNLLIYTLNDKPLQYIKKNLIKDFKLKYLIDIITAILNFYSFILNPLFVIFNPTQFFQYLRGILYLYYKTIIIFIKLFLENFKLNFFLKKNKLKDWLSIPFIYLIDSVEYSIIKKKKYMYFSVLTCFYKSADRYNYIQFNQYIKLKNYIMYSYYIITNYYIYYKEYALNFIFFKIYNYKKNIKLNYIYKISINIKINRYIINVFFKKIYCFIFLLIDFINNFILLFSLFFKKFFINLKIKRILNLLIKTKYKKYKIKKKIKIEVLLFFVMTKYYYRQYLAPIVYYIIFYPIDWIHRHTIYLIFLLTYFYTEDFNLEIVMFTFAEEHHNALAYLVRHNYLWPITIVFINLDLLYVIVPFLSTISLLLWSKRNQWYLGKWFWTFFIFPICLEFHRPLLIKLLWLLILEDYRTMNILFFKIPYISYYITLNNLYHIPLIIIFIWFIRLSINGLAYRHIWKKPNLPRWHYLRFPIYICSIEIFRFKIIYFIHILMLYYYEKLEIISKIYELTLYVENEPEAVYYYEFFLYTFLRIHIVDVLAFVTELKYLNSFVLGFAIDFWIVFIVLRCLSLYSRDFLNTDKKYGMFPQCIYPLCFKYFFYVVFTLWLYKQYLEIDIHLIIIFWIMKYSIFVFLYFQVTLYMFPRKVIPWYFSIISEFWPTLYNDIHKSMNIMIPTQDAMMVFQQIFEDIIKDWKKQRETYISDKKDYTFFYLWQFQVRKRKKLHLFAAYNRLMTRMHFMLREHMDLFYLGWRFDFYTNWRKRFIYNWKINPWRQFKFHLIYRSLILKKLHKDFYNGLKIYKFSIKYTYNTINYKCGAIFECIYLFNYAIFKQHIKSMHKKNYWLKTNLFVYNKRRKMLYDWKQDLFYQSRRYEELSILQDLKQQILANNLEPANEFGERPEIFWPPEYWLRYKKEGWKLFTDPEIDKFIYAPFSNYRYIPKYLYNMEATNKDLKLYMSKKQI